MEVMKNPLPGIIEPEKQAVNLLELVHERISRGERLTIRRSEADPRKQNKMLGYYPPYGVAYLSSPENTNVVFAIDTKNKTLVVDFKGGAFYEQRDAFVYRDVEGFEIKSTFNEFLAHFVLNGYQIKKFNPNNAGQYLTSFRKAEEIPREPTPLDIDAVLGEITKSPT